MCGVTAVADDITVEHRFDVVGVRSGTGAWAALALGVLALSCCSPPRWAGSCPGWEPWPIRRSRTDKSWFVVVRVLARLSVGFLATADLPRRWPPDEPEPATPGVVDVGNRGPTAVAH